MVHIFHLRFNFSHVHISVYRFHLIHSFERLRIPQTHFIIALAFLCLYIGASVDVVVVIVAR